MSGRIVALTAELESIAKQLAAMKDSPERDALLDEMRAILDELEVLTRLADRESRD